MDIKLTEYGWSGSADCSIASGNVVFNTDGHIINNKTWFGNKRTAEITADFIYNGLDIGLVLWYNYGIGHIEYVINKDFITIKRTIQGNSVILSRKPYDGIAVPVEGQTISLKAVLNNTNVKCYINEQEVFNIEQNFFEVGMSGILGSVGEKCSGFSIRSNSVTDWTFHIADAVQIRQNGLEQVVIIHGNPSAPFVYIEQNVDTSINGNYTVSFSYYGKPLKLRLYNGSNLLQEVTFPESPEVTRASHTFVSNNVAVTKVQIGADSVGVRAIEKPQVERKAFNTSFVLQSRERSMVTIPAGNLDKDYGGLSLWIKPKYNYTSGRMPIFYYNDKFELYYENGAFHFIYGVSDLSYAVDLEADKEYYVSCIWENGSVIILDVFVDDDHDYSHALPGMQSIPVSDRLYIGSTAAASANAIIDGLVAYKNYVDLDILLEHKDNEEMSSENIALKSSFNNGSLLYEGNKLSLPLPKANSPIIIENADEEIYSRVYFLEGGQYRPYNKEEFVYGSSKTFKVLYDDLIKVSAYTKDKSKIFENITIRGNEVTLEDLAEEHVGETIVIRYFVRNTFCINLNRDTRQYEIELSNTDGSEITIQYEEQDAYDQKLIKTIECNPFKSVNNSGFVYVESKPRELETFDIKVTPDSLMANGYDMATISIDCLSVSGVPTSNVDLEVLSLNGFGRIFRYISPSEQTLEQAYNEVKLAEGEEEAIKQFGHIITDEHRSGRFIYKYRAGSYSGEGTELDQIVIRDKVSGIGIQVPIRLVRES